MKYLLDLSLFVSALLQVKIKVEFEGIIQLFKNRIHYLDYQNDGLVNGMIRYMKSA